jgi:hypothetical protein
VRAEDVTIPPGSDNKEVKKILRRAIMPVTDDSVFVDYWDTARDSEGHIVWRVWAHR